MLTLALFAALQGPTQFVTTRAPVIALTNVRIIDGTGAAPIEGQTILIRGGKIAAIGPSATTALLEGAEVYDLAGRTVLPGYVMVHEHMYYPAGNGVYPEHSYSFPRLYLAGGTTTIRTGGSMVPYSDLNLKQAIAAERIIGPDMDVTAPYLNGPGLPILAVKGLKDTDDARRMVSFWADEGVTSFKAYMQISQEQLGAAIEVAHERGFKVTGHLCSVTYREATDLGIDNLEHGFFAATDFVANKRPDVCPSTGAARAAIAALDPQGPEIQNFLTHLISNGVAITSTLTVFETGVPGQPKATEGALAAILPQAREQYLRSWERAAANTNTAPRQQYLALAALEHEFARRGGLLLAGTDPTGPGGVVAGYANQRMIELLVESAGFTALEAIRVATLNGAIYLERDREIGSIEVGKDADLVVIAGNPATRIADVRNVEVVFKKGVGYDSKAIFASVRESVGWR